MIAWSSTHCTDVGDSDMLGDISQEGAVEPDDMQLQANESDESLWSDEVPFDEKTASRRRLVLLMAHVCIIDPPVDIMLTQNHYWREQYVIKGSVHLW